MAVAKTIGDYLIQKLYAHGVRHVFGVPGDYALGFFHELESSDIQVINTCDEQGAGFAADAYSLFNTNAIGLFGRQVIKNLLHVLPIFLKSGSTIISEV